MILLESIKFLWKTDSAHLAAGRLLAQAPTGAGALRHGTAHGRARPLVAALRAPVLAAGQHPVAGAAAGGRRVLAAQPAVRHLHSAIKATTACRWAES